MHGARRCADPGLASRSMKLVKCIVRPDFVAEVTAALETLGVSGITVTDVRGRGRRTSARRGLSRPSVRPLLVDGMIDMIASDDFVDDIVRAVIDHTRTGEYGDGRVLIMPIEEAYSIRTRQCGAA